MHYSRYFSNLWNFKLTCISPIVFPACHHILVFGKDLIGKSNLREKCRLIYTILLLTDIPNVLSQ